MNPARARMPAVARRSTSTPTSSSRSRKTGSTSSWSGSATRTRSRSTTRSWSRSTAAPWSTRRRHVRRLVASSSGQAVDRRRAGDARLRDPARDGAHVVRRPRDDAVVGRSLAERVVRDLRRRARGRREQPVHARCGRRSPAVQDPGPGRTGPDADDAPDRRRRARPRLGLGHVRRRSPIRRAPRSCSNSSAWVGPEQFAAGVHDYFAAHAWGNATAADLLDRAVRRLRAATWTTGPSSGFARPASTPVRPTSPSMTNGVFTSFAVIQEADAERPTLRSHRRGHRLLRHRSTAH